MTYDEWKLRSPDQEPGYRDDGPDEEPDDVDEPPDEEPAGCVLGPECCCPHVDHAADECFSADDYAAEWAEVPGVDSSAPFHDEPLWGWSPYPEQPAGNRSIGS